MTRTTDILRKARLLLVPLAEISTSCSIAVQSRPTLLSQVASGLHNAASFQQRTCSRREKGSSAYAQNRCFSSQHQSTGTSEGAVIRLRGLPFSATAQDVHEFLRGLDVQRVVLPTYRGRSTGDAYVLLPNMEAAEQAAWLKHKQNLGSRYIEVHHSSIEAMQAAALSMEANSSNPSQSDTVQYNTPANVSGSARYVPRTGMGGHRSAADRIVRMRGMPFDASTSDILKFLDGLPVLNVVWSPSRTGKGPSGIAFVQLTSTACVASALERHRKFMGDRYIELAVASREDMLSALEEAVRAE